MAAKLIDDQRAHEFQVMVLPNLYGDILTDEAGQIQGGVGTAGSANIGKQYAMFEVFMVLHQEWLQKDVQYADPCSMIKAASLLLQHIGYTQAAHHIQQALDITTQYEKKLQMTGRDTGATGEALPITFLNGLNTQILKNLEILYKNN